MKKFTDKLPNIRSISVKIEELYCITFRISQYLHGMKYRQVGNSWFLTGVVSFGTNACDSSLPGVYTRTSSFLPWLLDTLGTL